MLKKLIAIIVLASAPFVQAVDNAVVGVVNLEKVMLETKAGKSLNDQLKKMKIDFQNKYNQTGKDLEARRSELEKQKAALSKEAFAKKEEEFIKKSEEAQNSFNREGEAMDLAGRKAFTEFNLIVIEAVSKVAKENNFTHIMPAAVFAYFDDKTEVTDKVIAEVDKKITSFPLNLDQKK